MATRRISSDSIASLGPARDCAAVTPHDTNSIDVTRGILVTVAGNIAVRFVDASADVTIPVSANTLYAFAVTNVRATATTATGIFAFY